jgi:hypothetical protein
VAGDVAALLSSVALFGFGHAAGKKRERVMSNIAVQNMRRLLGIVDKTHAVLLVT